MATFIYNGCGSMQDKTGKDISNEYGRWWRDVPNRICHQLQRISKSKTPDPLKATKIKIKKEGKHWICWRWCSEKEVQLYIEQPLQRYGTRKAFLFGVWERDNGPSCSIITSNQATYSAALGTKRSERPTRWNT